MFSCTVVVPTGNQTCILQIPLSCTVRGSNSKSMNITVGYSKDFVITIGRLLPSTCPRMVLGIIYSCRRRSKASGASFMPIRFWTHPSSTLHRATREQIHRGRSQESASEIPGPWLTRCWKSGGGVACKSGVFLSDQVQGVYVYLIKVWPNLRIGVVVWNV